MGNGVAATEVAKSPNRLLRQSGFWIRQQAGGNPHRIQLPIWRVDSEADVRVKVGPFLFEKIVQKIFVGELEPERFRQPAKVTFEQNRAIGRCLEDDAVDDKRDLPVPMIVNAKAHVGQPAAQQRPRAEAGAKHGSAWKSEAPLGIHGAMHMLLSGSKRRAARQPDADGFALPHGPGFTTAGGRGASNYRKSRSFNAETRSRKGATRLSGIPGFPEKRETGRFSIRNPESAIRNQ